MTKLSKIVMFMMVLCMPSVRAEGIESIADRVMKKIASAFEKSVIRAGNTCGLPRINNVMKNLTLKEGETARFKCNVDMKCMVSYIQWYHQEFDTNVTSTLLRTGASMGNPYSYIIKDVSYEDEGFYSCVAGNTLGETVSSAFLEISKSSFSVLDVRIVSFALFAMFYNFMPQ